MTKFLKENWFKIGVIVLLILIFTYVIKSNNESKVGIISDTKYGEYAYNCSQKAIEVDKEEKSKLDNNYSVYTTNHFNSVKNKCYVYTEVYRIVNKNLSRNTDEFFYSMMRDGYENKVIFQCGAGAFSDVDGGCTDIGSINDSDFKEKHSQYFTE
ncbi:MAG TPA: hypothetical protein VJC14_02055 [Candidatus Paceibacterota bacterium]